MRCLTLVVCLLLAHGCSPTTFAVVPPSPSPLPSTPMAKWQDAFVAYPGARHLCTQNVLGFSGPERVEIAWQSYGSKDSKAKVIAFYEAHAEGAKIDREGGFRLRAEGDRILSVHGAGEGHPTCEAKPAPDEPTVIVTSRMMR